VSIARVAEEIGPDFELDSQFSWETVTMTERWKFRHRETAFTIELFLLSEDSHDLARFNRRVRGPVGDRYAFVPTAEDVIVTKLRWSRGGKRPKDVEDLKNLLDSQAGRLDLSYIRGWCDQHGTRALFEELLTEAEQFGRDSPAPP
jgi:hypothetical protein